MKPAGFTARYVAYSVDVALLLPLVIGIGWSILQRFSSARTMLEDGFNAALDRAFEAGHISLLSLAEALRNDPAFMASMQSATAALLWATLSMLALTVGLALLYFVAFEASPWQATPGKRLLGLRVETANGHRPALGRVVLRFVCAAPSWLLLHLGHAMVGWRADGRALHDLLAGTRVQGPEAEALPAWARTVLALQVALLGVIVVLAAWRMAQAVWVMGI